jgi:amino acid transporter
VDLHQVADVIKEASTRLQVALDHVYHDTLTAAGTAKKRPPSRDDISSFWTGVATTLGTVATFAGAFTYSSLEDACVQSDDICTVISVAFLILVMALFTAVGAVLLARPGMISHSPLHERIRLWIIVSAVCIMLGFVVLTVSIGLLYGTKSNEVWIVVGVTIGVMLFITIILMCHSTHCQARHDITRQEHDKHLRQVVTDK